MFLARPPFDLALSEPAFPRVSEVDDSQVTQALIKRNADLSPSSQEQTAIMNLVTKVTAVIEKLIVAPELFTAAGIEEVRQVGSFKKGTMVTKRNVADLVVIFKTLPTVEAVTALGNRISEDIRSSDQREVLGCVPRDFGCEIAGTQAVVRILIATIPSNLRKLDPALHLSAKLLQNHLAAIRHARWFEENASHTTIKILVRLWKDIRDRFVGFRPLTPWMIELLAHYAVMNTANRQPLALNQAFKRTFQLLGAGLLLPGCAGIVDPCEPNVRIQDTLPPDDQDIVCANAQTLLRVLSHGGYKHILGFEGNASVATDMSVWEGVVVTPLERAYDADADYRVPQETE